MKFKQVFIPDEENHTIYLPRRFYGKKIEVRVVELDNEADTARPLPPLGKEIEIEELFETFGVAPDYPSTEDLF